MKVCTVFEMLPDTEELRPVDISVVEDDHKFGWVEELGIRRFHYEGSIVEERTE